MPRGLARVSCGLAAIALAALSVAPSEARAASLVRLEDDDSRLVYGGAWHSVWMQNASGQSYAVADQPGASVTATFEGDAVRLISRFGPDRGRLRITLDGAVVAEIDTSGPVRTDQQAVWDAGVIPAGTHVVTVESLGRSQASSSSSTVVFDALEINGVPVQGTVTGQVVEDGDGRLAKFGSWWVSQRTGASGGRGWRSKSVGASVTVKFTGTGVRWLGRKDPEGGLADVVLDGRRVGRVSQHRAATAERVTAYSISGLDDGVHTLTVRVLGKVGSGGGKKIDVDEFLVEGTPLKAATPSPFRYPWKRYIVIDKSEFKLYWVKDGVLVKTYPVALGRVGMTTPSRVWRVGMKYKTDPRGVYGPRKMRLFKRVGKRYVFTRYGIHGTNQQWVIGTRASHGCIRMYNKDVRELWNQVPVGTMVVTRD